MSVDRDQQEIDSEVERILNLPTAAEYRDGDRDRFLTCCDPEPFPWIGAYLLLLTFVAGFVAGALVVAYR